MTLRVLEPGSLALVQDLGRAGLARFGLSSSGAMDRGALTLANRLVGNPEDAAGLELLLGGARVRADAPVWIAVTGAWGAVTLEGAPLEPHTAIRATSGAVLEFGLARRGIRFYLAARGGIAVPAVLGSRSRDTLAALGPAPLSAGDLVPLGPEPASPVPPVDFVPVDPPGDGPVELELYPGPRRDWFIAAAWSAMLEARWRVSPRSDRTGIRLDGPALERLDERELPSEGMVPGAIQVSPDGAPTILGADHPVTGGYPVIGVVGRLSLDALAQLRPGQAVRFIGR